MRSIDDDDDEIYYCEKCGGEGTATKCADCGATDAMAIVDDD